MITSQPNDLTSAVLVLKQCISATEGASLVAHRPSTCPLGRIFRKSITPVPESTEWRIFNHCAAITRLYAVFERFVEDSGAAWLRCLPNIYTTYDMLPPVVQYEHKTGVGRVLPKTGEGRFKHLTALEVIRGLHNGFSRSSIYDLPLEAFVIAERNLRIDVLCEFFRKIGIPELRGWIDSHPDLIAFMDNNYGGQQTAAAQLDSFIDYRNEAAHGYEINDVLSANELLKLADFIVVLGQIVAERLNFQYWKRCVETKPFFACGEITEYLRRPDAHIAVISNMTITKGQPITVLETNRCRSIVVKALQENDRAHDSFVAVNAVELGLKLEFKVPIGAKIINPNAMLPNSDDNHVSI